MALSSAAITMNLADMLGTDFDTRRTKIWVTTNVPGDTVIDTLGNAIRVGSGGGANVLAADGTATLSVWIPGTGSNPATWQTTINVDYPDPGTRSRKVRAFGPFTITASADLADLVEEQEVPPEYLTTVTTLLDGYVDSATAASVSSAASATSAAASAALAEDISGIVVDDDVVATLVADGGSDTRVALSASYVPKAITKAATTGSTVLREVIDPNRTASKWREVYDTALFQTTRYDPVMLYGWNADKAAGGGDAAEPAVYMGFEADYWDTATDRTMEWYVGVIRADSSGPLFRPFAFTAARDGNTDLTASVQVDIGDNSGPTDRSQFQIMAGATELAKWLPSQVLLKTPVLITPPTGMQAAVSLVTAASGDIGQIIFQDGGSAKWSIRKDHTTGTELKIRDEVNNGTIMRMYPGASNIARAVFIDAVVCPIFCTTGGRPNAGNFAAGGMVYDTTLSKPIWTNGTVWKDAAGTTV